MAGDIFVANDRYGLLEVLGKPYGAQGIECPEADVVDRQRTALLAGGTAAGYNCVVIQQIQFVQNRIHFT